MGYNTRYTVKRAVWAGEDRLGTFREAIAAVAEYGREAFTGDEPVKWYDHEEHIALVMRETRTATVELHGEGEEQGDVWDKLFNLREDGVVEIREFTYELRRPDAPTDIRTVRS